MVASIPATNALGLCRRCARLISRVSSHADFSILSMADIGRVCVELFPLFGTVGPSMDGLERLLQRLLAGT
jgi:hypothetical protein